MTGGRRTGDPSPAAERVREVLQQAHRLSVCTSAAEQAAAVQARLGSRLAAAALGLDNTRNLLRWGQGGPVRCEDTAHRLQVLYRVVTAISLAHDDAVAVAFMRGCNPELDNQAPVDVLANDRPTRSEPRLLSAVETLLAPV